MTMQRGYEFTDAGPRLRPDFAYDDLRETAAHPFVTYAEVTVNVPTGKTAWDPADATHVLRGPASVKYRVYPEGIYATVLR